MPLPVTRPVRTTPPTPQQEPVTLEEAKKQVGIAQEVSYHDQDIGDLVAASRAIVESNTGLVCYTGAYVWKFTKWPDEDWIEIVGCRPVTSVDGITYIALDGTTTTFDPSNWQLETSGVQQYIRLQYLKFWPPHREDINGIVVNMTAGYSSVANVPRDLKRLVRLKISELWKAEQGEDVAAIQQAYNSLFLHLNRATYP